MYDYELYDTSTLDTWTQKRLGRVFLSKATRAFVQALVNGQGELNLHDCLEQHALTNASSLGVYFTGDVVYIDRDRNGHTFVRLQCEALSAGKGGERDAQATNR